MGKDRRNIYLTNIPLGTAQHQYFQRVNAHANFVRIEEVGVLDSLHRVTSKPIFALASSPSYNAAAMDGIAVVAETTYTATEKKPLSLYEGRDFVFVNTGKPIEEPFNSVIMIEDIVVVAEGIVEIYEPARPWQHIRPIGEDIVAGELILPANHRIRPMDIGALLGGRIQRLEVYALPRVGIIPTGSEIIEVDEPLEEGKIIESNSRMFEAMIKSDHGIPNRYPVVKDNEEDIKASIKRAVEENDIVIINAGSSAGAEDYTVNVLGEMGEVVIHGVATKPGKPVILAIVEGKPVIGIPGYPVSAYFVFEFFVKPLLFQYNRQRMGDSVREKAILSRRIVSSLKHEEYVRMKLGWVEGKLIATPLERGAGVTMSLVRADGVLVVPQALEGYEGGNEVEVQLLKPLGEIQNTIVSIGSHDLVMDLLANEIHKQYPHLCLSSAHVGSLGGLMAMKRRECHIAPIHLLEEESGTYNKAYLNQYVREREMALIKFVKRSQGLIIERGNPLNIQGLRDLVRGDVQFVNRQRGAGTRILLDYHLKKEGLVPNHIGGYEREMTTHMAVAAAVASGRANCGMGIYSAAKTMGLDFIPIAWEDYDLSIPREMLKEEKIKVLLEILCSDQFVGVIKALGGYDVEEIGKIIYI